MQYWCSERLVITVEGPDGRSVVRLDQPFALVGSHSGADVQLSGSTVAQRALYLHATPEGVYCLFLDVPAPRGENRGTWLAPSERVAFGEYSVQASLPNSDVANERPAVDLAERGSAVPPLPVLRVFCGDLLKDKRRLRSRLTLVGRRPQCGLQLRGKNVSSFHCVLYWDGLRFWCIDLESSNGTTLNGTSVDSVEIQIGDRLEVGEFAIVFQRLSQGGEPPPATSTPTAASDAPQGPTDQSTTPELESNDPPTSARGGKPAEGVASHEIWAADMAQLGSQREALQVRWADANEQLTRQVAALQEEAAHLAREREALASARSQFFDYQNLQMQELAERSSRLAELEANLTLATQVLSTRLDQSPQIPSPQSATSPSAAAESELLAVPLAPATVLAGLPVEPGESGLVTGAAQQVVADTSWEAVIEVARLAEPIDSVGATSSSESHQRDAISPEKDELAERLQGQIDRLQAELTELANQRLALEQSRQDWQAERQALTEQLTMRDAQLARLQSDLVATTAELQRGLVDAEAVRQREDQRSCDPAPAAHFEVMSEDGREGNASAAIGSTKPDISHQEAAGAGESRDESLTVQDLGDRENNAESLDEAPPAPTWPNHTAAGEAPAPAGQTVPSFSARSLEKSRRGTIAVAATEELAMLVSSRVGEKYSAPNGRWLWWSAGGIAVALLVAAFVVVVTWVF